MRRPPLNVIDFYKSLWIRAFCQLNNGILLKSLFLYFFLSLLFLPQLAQSETPIVIDDLNTFKVFRGKFVDHLEDPTGKLTIREIASPAFRKRFVPGVDNRVAGTSNVNSSWWLRITIIDSTVDKHVLFELFDFRIDNFEIYVPYQESFKVYKGGSTLPFEERGHIHKNYVFDLYHPRTVPVTIYVKLKTNEPVSFIGAIRTCDRLIHYASLEYFLLSLFYGITIAMMLYNLFLFLVLRDWTYLFYILYVFSIAVYTLCQDGLGFQFLWPDYPLLNDYVGPLALYFIIVCGLLYARSFLNIKRTMPLMDKGLLLIIAIRTLVFIAWIFYPSLSYLVWIDLVPFVFVYVCGILSWYRGYSTARFYVLAFTMFFFGFTIYTLQHFNIITPQPLTVYSLYLGVLCEMLLLSLALADRIKMLIQDKESAQRNIIGKLQENDWLKDQLNKELERKVLERTREFDHFVYRSSHDIKGPLKSIIGLTSVGLKDVDDVVARKYFEHILKSSRRLDSAIDHLSKLMELRESEFKISKVDFQGIIKEVYSGFLQAPGQKRLNLKINYNSTIDFYSDEKLIYSIFYNLIENAIKFRDDKKKESYLEISIKVKKEFAYIVLKDNGLGIDRVSQEKVFDMFYKINPESPGPGLGLYMIKISIDRLSGTIRVNSKEGQGTTMKLALKNSPIEKPILS